MKLLGKFTPFESEAGRMPNVMEHMRSDIEKKSFKKANWTATISQMANGSISVGVARKTLEWQNFH